MFVDTHAHLNFKAFNKDYKEVIKRAFDAGVKGIINVGSNWETSQKAVEIAKTFSNSQEYENNNIVRVAIGLHPIHVQDEKFDYDQYLELAKDEKVVAIGETGLDYFRLDESSKLQNPNDKSQISSKSQIQNYKPFDFAQGRQIQKQVFEEHIRLAKELNLPLILHCRGSADNPYGAYDEMLKIIKSEIINHKSKIVGVIHCFGGILEQAQEFIKLGFYIGFTGVVTFKNATELQNIVREISLDKILIETDCPFLAPVPYRGQRNEPAYVVEIARKIAELKDIPLEEVEKTTSQNAIQLFNLD